MTDVDVPDGAGVVAVLLHPHPDMGGDRFNHVIGALFRGLPAAGIGAVRFDFGTADLDRAAAATVAALDAAADAAPGARLAVVGYSFGSMVALRVTDARVAGWCLVALPVDHAPPSPVPDDPRPKLVLVPEHDFTSPDAVAAATSSWAATERRTIHGADHFLGSASAGVLEHVVAWLQAGR